LTDGKGVDLPGPAFLRNLLLKKLESTEIEELLKDLCHQLRNIGSQDR